jgi:adenylate kinase family enzyme
MLMTKSRHTSLAIYAKPTFDAVAAVTAAIDPVRRRRKTLVPWGTLLGVRRVAVVGSGGAGKSTFARQLGERTGIPVIHLDRHYWKPGWVQTAPHQWRARQAELVAGESWIIDGNYGGTFDVRFACADTVIVLALPRWLCVTRALRRTLRDRGRDLQAGGCPERVDLAFLRWVWRYPIDSRPRLNAALERHQDRLRVIELTSPTEVRMFLATLGE